MSTAGSYRAFPGRRKRLTPIEDGEYLATLTGNASAFLTGDATIAMRLVPDAVYDLGGDVADDSVSLAAVDVAESSEFQQYLTRRLGFDVSRENTWAGLVTGQYLDVRLSHVVGAPVMGRRQFVLVNSHEYTWKRRDVSAYSLHVLDDLGLRTCSTALFARGKTRPRMSAAWMA